MAHLSKGKRLGEHSLILHSNVVTEVDNVIGGDAMDNPVQVTWATATIPLKIRTQQTGQYTYPHGQQQPKDGEDIRLREAAVV